MFKKISRFLRFSEKRSVKIILILFFIINMLKESTRCFNNITFKKFKNNLIKDKKACLARSNSNNCRK